MEMSEELLEFLLAVTPIGIGLLYATYRILTGVPVMFLLRKDNDDET